MNQWAEAFAGLDLAGLESAYQTAIGAELERIAHMPTQAKRRATILGLAEAETRADISRQDVFDRPDTVSARIFYSKEKDWYHDELYRDVLDTVIKIVQAYHAAKDLAEAEQRRQDHRERMLRLSDKAAGKLEQMINFPLFET